MYGTMATSLAVEQARHSGAVLVNGGMSYCLWAPAATRLAVLTLPGRTRHELDRGSDGSWSGFVPFDRSTGNLRYKLLFTGSDNREQELPDPLSHFQPEGPHGPAELQHSRFRWTDGAWPGVELRGQIISEIHIGTFTAEGTYAAAESKLPLLAEAGITTIELLPLSEFPGKFGWGYDGVQMFAPYHGYGTPDELRSFVNAAHKLGLGVLLDVVFNHFGPDGNYMGLYAPAFFTDRHHTPWGKAIAFDGENSHQVREFFLYNAEYWIREFHFDGLRLDASQSMLDDSKIHILEEIATRVHETAAPRKSIVVAENDERDARLIRDGGFGLDGIWSDDLHHSVRVALTGVRRSYLAPFQGTPQELLSAARNGFLFAGQSMVQNAGQMLQQDAMHARRRMGHSSLGNLPLWRFVHFIENHDQISVEKRGARLFTLTNLSDYRAMVTYLLLGPGTPMLFQGQEFGSRSPFPYFSDHEKDLQNKVRDGRYEYLTQFTCGADCDSGAEFPDPCAEETVKRATLQWEAFDAHPHMSAMFRELMHLRRNEPLLWDDGLKVEGTVLSADAFLLRYSAPGDQERLLLVNLGADWNQKQLPEPLLGLPLEMRWEQVFSSEAPQYGGHGTPVFEDESGYHLPAHSAVYLKAAPAR